MTDPNAGAPKSPWPIATVVIVIAILLAGLLALTLLLQGARQAATAVGRTGQQVADIAERFRSGTITTTFLAALPELEGAGLGNLELATSTVTEVFTRTQERRVLWDRVSLGETVVEIRVPVTYRYHVPLGDLWELEASGQTCIVNAPEIRPSLPPAIHTDRLERRSETSGWFPLDEQQEMRALERTLTPLLESYAGDRHHVGAVRDACRKTVANFVRAWLLRENHWRDDRFRSIVVHFRDEAQGATDLPERPTLSIED